MSKNIAEAAKPMMCGEALIKRIITEPIMPTNDAVPNLLVNHVTSMSVKKTAKSQKTGSPNQIKPNCPNVKFKAAHKAQNMLTDAMSTVLRYDLRFIKATSVIPL
jgi:hypothetical protein